MTGATLMEPGEKLKLDTLTRSFIKTPEDREYYSAWYENRWNFNETSLEKIAELITEYYGVKVLWENDELKQLKMSALLPVESLQKLQNIITATLNIEISESNNQMTFKNSK